MKGNEGYITDAIEISGLNIDKQAPVNLAIQYDKNFIQVVLETVTFGVYEAKSVTVTLSAADSNSKIAAIEYYLGGEKVTVDCKNENEVEYSFVIDKDYRNKVSFRAIDTAGNESELTETLHTLVVDTIAPNLEAVYEFESGNSNNYNNIIFTQKSVKVGFRFTEANLDLTNTLPVVNVNGTEQALSWTKENDVTLVSDMTLTGDGDYTVQVTFNDRSGNKTEFVQEIHIDSKAPVLTVTYDNNDAKYDNIYKLPRIADVSISEHNFDISGLDVVDISAKDIANDNVDISSRDYEGYITNPANWLRNGDTYTLDKSGMVFDIGAVYTIILKYTDLAGSEDQYETTFVIDQTDAKVVSLDYTEKVTEKFLNAITFGFFKDSVTVTATITDETSGVESAAITYTKETGASSINGETFTAEMSFKSHDENTNTFVYTYDIPANARGTVSVIAVDRAGNEGAKGRRDGADYSVGVVVDNKEPEREVIYTPDRILGG